MSTRASFALENVLESDENPLTHLLATHPAMDRRSSDCERWPSATALGTPANDATDVTQDRLPPVKIAAHY